ncbi:uncharacterized protein LOC143460427 [Clavelina lepadiformis]|uniref:uncharacterized protein LOC143460427 n=1 Tax=Clavelina lepadiformis TaxID=159417 RepID=UPI004040F29A
MKLAKLSFLFAVVILNTIFCLTEVSSTAVDCAFDKKRSFCRWKREKYGMRRAGWRSGSNLRGTEIEDHTGLDNGKFIYFKARSRPAGFRSRLRSVSVIPSPETCFVFWVAMGGANKAFPDGNSLLRLYFVGQDEPVEESEPVWTNGHKTPRNGQYTQIVVPLREHLMTMNSISSQFVFETMRGNSKQSYVVIDDVSLRRCDRIQLETSHKKRPKSGSLDLNEKEAMEKMKDVKKKMISLMLPAHRPGARVYEFEEATALRPIVASRSSNQSTTTRAIRLTSNGEFFPPKRITARVPLRRNQRRRGGKRGRKSRKISKGRRRKNRRKNKAKSNTREHGFGNVYLEKPTSTVRYNGPVSPATPPSIMCDFIEYTQRLQRCFRTFFSMLRQHPHTCLNRYTDLESCLNLAATSCVPTRNMETMRVQEIVLGTLRNNFKTKRVFCEEEGAFVYPEFAVDKVPIQCGSRYFIKLSECSGSFSNMFQLRHGNPKLCREYYQANDCQRQTTAEECNFDTETMLLYGLNLQYQFAHNPFCIHLPFSAWWPDS